jgi:hypothetical protein
LKPRFGKIWLNVAEQRMNESTTLDPTGKPSGALYHYVHESQIPATPEALFGFHESPEALTRLIPPWEKMKVVESSGSLKVGSRVILAGRILGIIPVRWVAVHTEYNPPHLFADQQASGPFAWWYHRHSMHSDGQGGSILRDEVEYRLPLGWMGRWFGGWLVRRKLAAMFSYRHQVTRQMTEPIDSPSSLDTGK